MKHMNMPTAFTLAALLLAAEPTPPPAVTIPLDRVDPKHRFFDPALGAAVTPTHSPQGTATAGSESSMPEPAAATPTQRPAPPMRRAPTPTIQLNAR